MVLKIKLKQTQPKIIKKQLLWTMFMEVERNIIKDGRNLKLEKEIKSIKDRTTRHIKNIFEQ